MRLTFTLLLLTTLNSNAQCIVTSSNNNYQVNLSVYPISLSNRVTNGGGCTFTAEMYYNITFTGSNLPESMNTLQGRVRCAGQNRTFDLPNNGGTGIVTSATGSAPFINGNCTAYNEHFCNEVVIIIQGTSIPPQEIICANPLPVELISFEGEQKENGISLSFITASEKNNDYFTIEKTINGNDWEVLQIVKGNSTTDKTSYYNIIDRNPNNNKIYYRLSQTDIDGTNRIHKIIAVNYNSISNTNYSMFPNPTANGELNIIFESKSDVPVLCKIYNVLGKEIGSYDLLNSNQLERVLLPESNTTYIIELSQENIIIARERIISN